MFENNATPVYDALLSDLSVLLSPGIEAESCIGKRSFCDRLSKRKLQGITWVYLGARECGHVEE